MLNVTETITWRFGADSPRHGIKRDLIVRERYNADSDVVYAVSNIAVTADPDVSNQLTTSTQRGKTGRFQVLELTIGDPNETISAPTATYEISYDLVGGDAHVRRRRTALRRVGLGCDRERKPDDQTGERCGHAAWEARDVRCFRGVITAKSSCDEAMIGAGGDAIFSQSAVAAGEYVTIAV